MKIYKKIFMKLASKGYFNWVPDNIYLKIMFKFRIGYKLNLKEPKTFNEKLQWLKLYNRNPLYTKLVDKNDVRSFIKEKIGEEYLIPQIGVYNEVSEIDFSKLPEKFVLKCTHDSGGIVICKNREKLDLEKSKSKLEKHMKNNYFYWGREWPYKNVKPRIVCEEFIEDGKNEDLIDYKFMCFNGKVKCSFVCLNRNSKEGLNVDFYDREWNKMPFERHYKNSNITLEKPKQYEKMIELSEKLAKDFPFVRVDFYEVKEKIYFGELTFFPGSGLEEFRPEEYDKVLGDWLKI